jgi:preprotein translocase subunit YajC
MGPVIIIVVLLALGYLLLVRPSRRRSASHAAMQDSVQVGDEIITAGGIHAIVREDDGEELRVEIAPKVVVKLDRRAVAAVAQEEGPSEDVEGESPQEDDPRAS